MFLKTITLFKIAGFPIRVASSWFLIAGLITWSIATQYLPNVLPNQSSETYITMAITAMLGLFASLILHELAHSLVARRFGVSIEAITLFIFGGMAEMADDMPSPRAEALIALAGPLMSFALAACFWVLATLIKIGPQSVTEVVFYLALINFILAVFNLLPAFPMDGGRILRAWIWHKNKNLREATQKASWIGVVFGVTLIGLGLLNVNSGLGFGGLWLVLIGGFVALSSHSGYQQVLTQSTFQGRTVGEMMSHPAVIVDPAITLTSLVNDVFLKHRISFAPVMDDGVLIGHVDVGVLAALDQENWDTIRVDDVFIGLEKSPVIASDFPIIGLMKLITQSKQRKFMVCDKAGLVGVITLSDLLNYLEISRNLAVHI